MSIYKRQDSPFWWMALEGFMDARGNPLRESTRVRHDGTTPLLRAEAKAQALKKYHARMLELAEDTGEGEKPRVLMGEFIDWYSKHVLPGHRGAERELEVLPRWKADYGDRFLHTIDQELIAEWMTARVRALRDAHSPTLDEVAARLKHAATVNREVDTLKAVLQAAVPKYLDASPLAGMPRYRQLTPKRRIMTEDEETRLLKALAPDDKALFLLGLDSLVRLTDLLDLKRTDDHGDHVWVADPKAGGGFSVPVSARARVALDAAATWRPQFGKLTEDQRDEIHALLKGADAPSFVALGQRYGVSEHAIRKLLKRKPRRAPAASEYLFARRRGTAKTERDRRAAVRQMLKRACAKADPPVPYGRKHGGITFHWATRRTGATRMLTRGVDLGTTQKVGRWKRTDVVLGIYHELLDGQARAAVEAVGPREPHVNDSDRKTTEPAAKRRSASVLTFARKPGRSA